jgi:hypothetical protein
MRAALLLHDGQAIEAWSLLAKNARIHERMMNGTSTLIGAMIALVVDFKQQRLIAGMLRTQPALAASDPEHLPALVKTPRATGPEMSRALRGETRFQLSVYHALDQRLRAREPKLFAVDDDDFSGPMERLLMSSPVAKLTYLPNETMNEVYVNGQAIATLADLPADQLSTAAASVDAAHRAAIGLDSPFFPLPLQLRNPTGKILLNIGAVNLSAYIERAHDVDGHRRLLRLQIAALQQGIPPEQMPRWLAAQPPDLRNPYTLQPMGWDAATQSLVFEGRQPQNQNPEPRNIYRVRLAP